MKKILLISLIVIFSGQVVFAQNTVTGSTNQVEGRSNTVTPGTTGVLPKITNPLKFKSLEALISGLVSIALQLGVIVAVLALVWVGFKFILAQGNDGKISEAKNALQWVIIGIAILFGAQIIVEIIKGTLSGFIDPSSWLRSN